MKSFLTFARPRRPQLESIDVNALINTTLALYSGGHSGKVLRNNGIHFELRLGELPKVTADPMQLQQVFLNLVINAIEAMHEKGTLSIETVSDGEAVTATFADSGPGVAPDDAEKVFQPFFTSKPKGTGLGLAISRQLIEQQGGKLTLVSGQGEGARFVVELPVSSSEEETGA
jgi:signal transduction histidine kinase